MIGVIYSAASTAAGQLVLASLRRSVGVTQARAFGVGALNSCPASVLVAVNPPNEFGDALTGWLATPGRKLLVFGQMPRALATRLNCQQVEHVDGLADAARSARAASRCTSQSSATVRYTQLAASLGAREWVRPFERFDFTDEWNNLGFGAIRADGSIWSVGAPLDVPGSARLASVYIEHERQFAYAALWDDEATSVLWFNRATGPCDSFEWRVVENFLSGYRAGELRCQPVLSEVPWGYDAVITSRLDCDEDVESARALWTAYRRLRVPFSLAVHTANLAHSTNHAILRELAADPSAAILSHTATHAPNWGGSYEAALAEGRESAHLLESVIARPVRYAVSPFHQTPHYALEGLADAGYSGCIGGIIRNDPEFLLARGGILAGMPQGFVGHSQQCMLHGDCMLAEGDPLGVFRTAFDLAYETKTLFGYLDHPFSARYQYGWRTEDERISAHEEFIAYIRARAERPLFINEEVAMDLLLAKSMHDVTEHGDTYTVTPMCGITAPFPLAVEYCGELLEITDNGRLR
ncbi:polysaccharide deacetylase [Burkholderia multivorans]|uniref:polysaccharide deacetylase n=1 Tax=Burkholderia multivorans TaxID=87883 RepID=UPI00158B5614|nr:polysaccharide deacetylase [Burkholderia multivorans]